jgi:hypothetical protein
MYFTFGFQTLLLEKTSIYENFIFFFAGVMVETFFIFPEKKQKGTEEHKDPLLTRNLVFYIRHLVLLAEFHSNSCDQLET